MTEADPKTIAWLSCETCGERSMALIDDDTQRGYAFEILGIASRLHEERNPGHVHGPIRFDSPEMQKLLGGLKPL